MHIANSIADVRSWRADEERRAGGRISLGLVPTMGYLHEGHLSLVRRARAENDRVAVSIFVNPAQFNAPSDLENYPRDIERDLALLRAGGCDLVLVPPPEAMYPPGFQTWVEPGAVAAPLEGAHRPGHFRGVATVVLKLFGIFEPARAYFGLKDYQQLAVIQTMVRDLDVPVEIVGCPTLREPDGLAMSSRNARLGPEDRAAAVVLHRALSAARERWEGWEDGEADAEVLRDTMRAVIASEPRAQLEYASVADALTLAELETVRGPALLSLAVRVGPVRLIDNIVLAS